MNENPLEELFPVPAQPINSGNPAEWEEYMSEIDVKLPYDLVWLVSNYGQGLFCDFLSIFSLFMESYDRDIDNIKIAYKYLNRSNPDDFRDTVGTEAGNIFFIGNTANGDELFYHLNDIDCNKWMIRFYPTRNSTYLDYNLSITEYIFAVFRGDIV